MSPPNKRVEETDPLDGPTKEFKRHHTVVRRSGGEVGNRIQYRIEQMFHSGEIDPNSAAAGKRFTDDYLRGRIGQGRSCIDISVRGNGDFPEGRHDASRNFEAARLAVNGLRSPDAIGVAPSEMLLMVCVEDAEFTRIGDLIGKDYRTVKKQIVKLLQKLSEHYAAADLAEGRGVTFRTRESVERIFDPDIAPPKLD